MVIYEKSNPSWVLNSLISRLWNCCCSSCGHGKNKFGILAWKSPWRGAWLATVHRVTKSWTWLSNWAHTLRTLKKWCLQTVLLRKTPESPLDSKEIKPVNLKGDQPWILTGRNDAEAEAPVFWPSDANRWLTGKFPDSGKIQGQKKKRASKDEMAGWHHHCNEHELGQPWELGKDREAWCTAVRRVHKELDTTGRPNSNVSFILKKPFFFIETPWRSSLTFL